MAWTACSTVSGPMNSAAPASRSCCAGAVTVRGSLRVSRAITVTRRPPTPPAAFAASMARSSARSELMLLAARSPEYDSSTAMGTTSPGADLPQPGPAAASSTATPAIPAERMSVPPVLGDGRVGGRLHVGERLLDRLVSRGRGKEVGDHGARDGFEGPARDPADPAPAIEQRLHPGQHRIG